VKGKHSKIIKTAILREIFRRLIFFIFVTKLGFLPIADWSENKIAQK
jgi:hypothetical protein